MNTLRRHVRISLILCLAIAPWSLGRPQDSDSAQNTPPSPPYVTALSGDFTLVKKFTYSSEDPSLSVEQKASQSLPTNTKELDAVKNGPIRKDTETFVDGTVRVIWRVDFYRFTTYMAHPDAVDLDIVGKPNDSPLLGRHHDSPDFPELSWITGTNFQGIQVEQDKKCYAYKSGDQLAWIDASNGQPIYFKSKLMQVSYTFSAPPDEPLQLPAGYAQKLEKFKRALRGQL